QDYPKNRHPGWSRGSVAYHAGEGPPPSKTGGIPLPKVRRLHFPSPSNMRDPPSNVRDQPPRCDSDEPCAQRLPLRNVLYLPPGEEEEEEEEEEDEEEEEEEEHEGRKVVV
ncbi:SPRY3 protein, partial [Urocolius indicus]|nr:SPRY3 protein [Urocolius indicus]